MNKKFFFFNLRNTIQSIVSFIDVSNINSLEFKYQNPKKNIKREPFMKRILLKYKRKIPDKLKKS